MSGHPAKLRVGVIGATGYVGSEALRWLVQHPDVVEVVAASRSAAGQLVSDAVPALLDCGLGRLAPVDAGRLAELDAVLLATPHGAAGPLVQALDDAGAKLVLDLSADHRHAPGFVYGLAEFAGPALKGASRIAVPGCFASAIALSLAPFAAAGVLAGQVHVSAATGSTGSGVSPSRGTHHPERFANLKAYKVLNHQHIPEVRAFLASLLGGPAPELLFVPHSAPVDRGIFATVFAPLASGVDAVAIVRDAYASAPLVRLRADTPELRHVRGTAFTDLAVHQAGDTAVVLCAIDNLGKGAAAQAIQCLNLATGRPVDRGLRLLPATP